jgi:hypothetical protein
MVARDSILNHIPLEGIMQVTYKFTHTDSIQNHELSVPETLDMSKYIEEMTASGFKVECQGDTIQTASGTSVVELKEWPETRDCDYCDDLMDLVSIETGYSCRNPECTLHMEGSSCLKRC